MKKKILIRSVVISIILFMTSFMQTTNDENFIVDTKRSSIQWVAKKIAGKHTGNIQLASGQLVMNHHVLKDGIFLINMASIACSDLEGEWNKKIIDHLNSDDFFSVEKNPTSKFQITKITPAGTDLVNVTGDLTIKGITEKITFVASIKRNGNELLATAKDIKIDRTKYGIKYGSKSFFAGIGDKAIDNEFELTINLIATK